MDNSMDNKVYSQYLIAFGEQIEYLKTNGFPGLFTSYAEVCKPQSTLLLVSNDIQENDHESGSSSSLDKLIGEELVIKLPFAGTNFVVRILFSLHEPWIAPDFIFSDCDFMKSITVKELEEFIPCLNNWNFMSEDIVSQLLFQIHQLYKHYQLRNLEKENEVLLFEYNSLLQSLDISEEDIEVSVSGGNSWLASILIKLPLSLRDVPLVLIEGSKESSNLLHLRIRKDDGTFIPKLVLSSQVTSLMEGDWESDLPSVPPGTSISDYVARILDLMEDKMKYAVKCFEARKQFVADLLCRFSGSVLEYDSQMFNRASFLYEVKGFYFIIEVNLMKFFPKDKPVMHMRSIYHTTARGQLTRQLALVNYNSKTGFDEIISKMKSFILKAVPNFQSMHKD